MTGPQKHSFWSGLTRKLLAGFGGVMVVLFVVAALLVAFLTSHSRALEAVQHENYDSVRYCDAMRGALDQAQAIAQENPPSADAPEMLEKARQDFESNAQSQLHNTTLLGEKERSVEAVELGRVAFQKTRQLLTAPAVGDRTAFYRREILPAYQQSRGALSEVSQMNVANLVRVDAQVRSALLAMRTTVILLLIIGLALSCVFVVLTARGMIVPLKELIGSVNQIKGGNRDLIVETGGDDEIGQLAEAFNEMAAQLREFRRMDLERLVRTQQTTQTAIDSLPDAVAVVDLQGRIEISNRTAQVHFNLAPGAELRAIRPDWAATFLDPVLATGQSVVPEGYRSAIQLFDASGERFLLPRATPMFDLENKLIGVTLVLVEITHLRRADEFKSGLLSAVSHELKTPLTSVRMTMRMLEDKRIGELNDKQQRLLAAATLDSERLVRTVEDILTIGRVEAGRARLELAEVAADDVVQRALATVEGVAADRCITLVKQVTPTDPLHVDLNLMACALSNLLSNAVKFSPAGSSVTLRVQESQGQVEFAVQDQGPGVPAELRARIFEKFFRIPTPGGPPGAGLGLSIAAEIMQMHGGTIAVEDGPGGAGGGAKFSLRVPREAAGGSGV